MIIANPIYDVVFKRLMEDQRIARFFIETLTGESIVDIEIQPQEYTWHKEAREAKDIETLRAIKEKYNVYDLLAMDVYRLDFLATIKTPEGCKKVLIEIQKAKNAVDLMRFRNYLAEQYKKEDEVMAGSGKTKMALPLITIYLLGFKLSEIETSVIKVNRQYIDLITNQVIHQKSNFIEKLTHDSYVVQIPRIQPRLQSRLEALLTIFEQANFADEREITKNYLYPVDDEQIKAIIAVLHHAGTDPAERVEIEKEQEAFRIFDLNFGKLRQTIEEKEKIISEKDKAIEEKDKLIEELKRQLGKNPGPV